MSYSQTLYENGMHFFNNRDYGDALATFLLVPKHGKSYFMLGVIFYFGYGIEIDYAKSLDYFYKSQKLGVIRSDDMIKTVTIRKISSEKFTKCKLD